MNNNGSANFVVESANGAPYPHLVNESCGPRHWCGEYNTPYERHCTAEELKRDEEERKRQEQSGKTRK